MDTADRDELERLREAWIRALTRTDVTDEECNAIRLQMREIAWKSEGVKPDC